MNKHTPGPWDYGWEIQPNGCPTVGHKGLMVCMVAHSAKDPDQKETALANANLISASPDLLAAAEEVVEAWSKFIDSFDYVPGIGDTAENIEFQEMMRLRMAINKAKGINQ